MDYSALSFLVLLGLIHFGSSIMCYECNSATNAFCNAKVLPDELKRNCSEHDRGITHTLCRKIVQVVEHEVNGLTPTSRVIRGCGWDESKYKGVCYQRSGYGGKQEVCSCTTDFCNAASQSTAPAALLMTLALAALNKQLCE